MIPEGTLVGMISLDPGRNCLKNFQGHQSRGLKELALDDTLKSSGTTALLCKMMVSSYYLSCFILNLIMASNLFLFYGDE